jgi:hypothetical protein
VRSRAAEVVLLLALAFFLCSCRDDKTYVRVQPGTPLIDGFMSYERFESVRQTRLAALSYVVTEEAKLPKGDPRPPFDQLTISVPEFTHLGHPGELRLSFFNDRLASVWFYPVRPAEYLQKLRARGSLPTDD